MNWAPLSLSLQIATLAMLLSLVVGTGLAMLLDWKRLPLREVIYSLVLAPLVLPPTVLGYYLLVALGRDSFIGRAWNALTGGTIVLPLAAPSLGAGAMLAFARALGDYGITQMVAGQMIHGTETASIHVMNALYGGREIDARNMALATTIVGVSLLYIANRLVKKYAGGHV